jgi:hypothetical protein
MFTWLNCLERSINVGKDIEMGYYDDHFSSPSEHFRFEFLLYLNVDKEMEQFE